MQASDVERRAEGRLQWYALRVAQRRETRLQHELSEALIESFWPTYAIETRYTDRVKTVERALFPGYLFCRVDLASFGAAKLLQMTGVVQILPRNLTPQGIPDAQIAGVRAAIESRLPLDRCTYVAGSAVVVTSGPLAGVEGVVVRDARGGTRLVILVSMLNAAVSVEVDPEVLITKPVMKGNPNA